MKQALTVLDGLLDLVKAGEREVTIDVEGYASGDVQRIIDAAKGRGFTASYDGRVVLVRDLRRV